MSKSNSQRLTSFVVPKTSYSRSLWSTCDNRFKRALGNVQCSLAEMSQAKQEYHRKNVASDQLFSDVSVHRPINLTDRIPSYKILPSDQTDNSSKIILDKYGRTSHIKSYLDGSTVDRANEMPKTGRADARPLREPNNIDQDLISNSNPFLMNLQQHPGLYRESSNKQSNGRNAVHNSDDMIFKAVREPYNPAITKETGYSADLYKENYRSAAAKETGDELYSDNYSFRPSAISRDRKQFEDIPARENVSKNLPRDYSSRDPLRGYVSRDLPGDYVSRDFLGDYVSRDPLQDYVSRDIPGEFLRDPPRHYVSRDHLRDYVSRDHKRLATDPREEQLNKNKKSKISPNKMNEEGLARLREVIKKQRSGGSLHFINDREMLASHQQDPDVHLSSAAQQFFDPFLKVPISTTASQPNRTLYELGKLEAFNDPPRKQQGSLVSARVDDQLHMQVPRKIAHAHNVPSYKGFSELNSNRSNPTKPNVHSSTYPSVTDANQKQQRQKNGATNGRTDSGLSTHPDHHNGVSTATDSGKEMTNVEKLVRFKKSGFTCSEKQSLEMADQKKLSRHKSDQVRNCVLDKEVSEISEKLKNSNPKNNKSEANIHSLRDYKKLVRDELGPFKLPKTSMSPPTKDTTPEKSVTTDSNSSYVQSQQKSPSQLPDRNAFISLEMTENKGDSDTTPEKEEPVVEIISKSFRPPEPKRFSSDVSRKEALKSNLDIKRQERFEKLNTSHTKIDEHPPKQKELSTTSKSISNVTTRQNPSKGYTRSNSGEETCSGSENEASNRSTAVGIDLSSYKNNIASEDDDDVSSTPSTPRNDKTLKKMVPSRYKSTESIPNTPDVEKVVKTRSYNTEDVRKYMARKKTERKRQEKEAERRRQQEEENKQRKLEELSRKQRESARSRSRSRNQNKTNKRSSSKENGSGNSHPDLSLNLEDSAQKSSLRQQNKDRPGREQTKSTLVVDDTGASSSRSLSSLSDFSISRGKSHPIGGSFNKTGVEKSESLYSDRPSRDLSRSMDLQKAGPGGDIRSMSRFSSAQPISSSATSIKRSREERLASIQNAALSLTSRVNAKANNVAKFFGMKGNTLAESELQHRPSTRSAEMTLATSRPPVSSKDYAAEMKMPSSTSVNMIPQRTTQDDCTYKLDRLYTSALTNENYAIPTNKILDNALQKENRYTTRNRTDDLPVQAKSSEQRACTLSDSSCSTLTGSPVTKSDDENDMAVSTAFQSTKLATSGMRDAEVVIGGGSLTHSNFLYKLWNLQQAQKHKIYSLKMRASQDDLDYSHRSNDLPGRARLNTKSSDSNLLILHQWSADQNVLDSSLSSYDSQSKQDLRAKYSSGNKRHKVLNETAKPDKTKNSRTSDICLFDSKLQDEMNDSSSATEKDMECSLREVLPSETQCKILRQQASFRNNGSHTEQKPDLMHNKLGMDNTYNNFSINLVKDYFSQERARIDHQTAMYKIRKQALDDKARAEIAWIEQQKKTVRSKGTDDIYPALKQQQRDIIHSHREQKGDVQLIQDYASHALEMQRKTLMEAESVMMIQQSTQQGDVQLIQDYASHALEMQRKTLMEAESVMMIQQSTQQILGKLDHKNPKVLKWLNASELSSHLLSDSEPLSIVSDVSQVHPGEETGDENFEDLTGHTTILDDHQNSTNAVNESLELSRLEHSQRDLSQISQSSESVSHEKIAHDLKMKLDERYLTKREQQLRYRRQKAEKILEWKRRLDKEEEEVMQLEMEAAKKISLPVNSARDATKDDRKDNTNFLDLQNANQSERNVETGAIHAPKANNVETDSSHDGGTRIDADLLPRIGTPSKSTTHESQDQAVKDGTIPSRIRNEEFILQPLEGRSDGKNIIGQTEPGADVHGRQSPNQLELPTNEYVATPIGRVGSEESDSDESFSNLHSEATSDQSEIERRVKALQTELERKKAEASQLNKKKNREKMLAREEYLRKEIEAYNQLIEELSGLSSRETSPMVPVIKQPLMEHPAFVTGEFGKSSSGDSKEIVELNYVQDEVDQSPERVSESASSSDSFFNEDKRLTDNSGLKEGQTTSILISGDVVDTTTKDFHNSLDVTEQPIEETKAGKHISDEQSNDTVLSSGGDNIVFLHREQLELSESVPTDILLLANGRDEASKEEIESDKSESSSVMSKDRSKSERSNKSRSESDKSDKSLKSVSVKSDKSIKTDKSISIKTDKSISIKTDNSTGNKAAVPKLADELENENRKELAESEDSDDTVTSAASSLSKPASLKLGKKHDHENSIDGKSSSSCVTKSYSEDFTNPSRAPSRRDVSGSLNKEFVPDRVEDLEPEKGDEEADEVKTEEEVSVVLSDDGSDSENMRLDRVVEGQSIELSQGKKDETNLQAANKKRTDFLSDPLSFSSEDALTKQIPPNELSDQEWQADVKSAHDSGKGDADEQTLTGTRDSELDRLISSAAAAVELFDLESTPDHINVDDLMFSSINDANRTPVPKVDVIAKATANNLLTDAISMMFEVKSHKTDALSPKPDRCGTTEAAEPKIADQLDSHSPPISAISPLRYPVVDVPKLDLDKMYEELYEGIGGEWLDDDFGFGATTPITPAAVAAPKPSPQFRDQAPIDAAKKESKTVQLSEPEVKTYVPKTRDEIIPLIDQVLEVYWMKRRCGETWDEVDPPTQYMGASSDGSMEECSKRTYRQFLFELIGEILRDMYSCEEQEEIGSHLVKSSIGRQFFASEPPMTLDELRPIVTKHVLHVVLPSISGQKPSKVWVSRKKDDRVDRILAKELRKEELDWVNYENDALTIKVALTDTILNSLLAETAHCVRNTCQRKKQALNL